MIVFSLFQFLISAAVILAAGIQLTKYADQLSDVLGLGKMWIGMILLGLITSLPEAGSSMAAVAGFHAGDLAVGNIAGSNNFNLLLLVLMDIVYKQGALTNAVAYHRSHFLSAVFAMILAGMVIGEIAVGFFVRIPTFLGMSPAGLLIIGTFLYGMRRVYLSGGRTDTPADAAGDRASGIPLGRIYLGLGLSAVCVVAAAVWLAGSADKLAQSTGLGRTFVGSLFLALATSLPEMVVTLSALRIGQVDLAIGNIFGSNMINIFLLSLCDPLMPGRALLQGVSAAHLVTLATGVILTLIILQGLRQSHKRRFWRLGWDSWMVLAVYAAGVAVLYVIK